MSYLPFTAHKAVIITDQSTMKQQIKGRVTQNYINLPMSDDIFIYTNKQQTTQPVKGCCSGNIRVALCDQQCKDALMAFV